MMCDWGVCRDCVLKENCAEYKPYKRQCEDYEQYKEVLTNEEWFDTLSTEEKAEILANESKNVINDFENFDFKREHKEFWEMWLKQPHYRSRGD